MIGAATAALVVIVGVAFAFVTGDGKDVADSGSRVLQLTFDGEQCTYQGPSVLSAGQVEVVFHNESAEDIWFDSVRLDEGRTIQEIIDYTADRSSFGRPSWTVYIWSQDRISASSSSIPTMRTVAPGLHALMCGTETPSYAYFGSGLTVTP